MPAATNAQTISEFLAGTQLGPRQFHKSLSVWPLLLRDEPGPEAGYLTLEEAMEAGLLRIDELESGGSVPHVQVTNDGEQPVLFLFGEQIVGAKQNRAANASFLLPPRSKLVIDVSCVEAGRWDARPRQGFGSSGQVLAAGIRKPMASQVTRSRARSDRGRFRANQGDVWKRVGLRMKLMAAPSFTSSYGAYHESRSRDLDELRKSFRPLDRQVGFVASIGDEVAGLEAIGDPVLFARQFEALLRSYAIDAIDAGGLRASEETGRPFDAPEAFLETLANAPERRGDSLGLGEDVRVEGGGVMGCALVHGALVHLTAFPESTEPGGQRSRDEEPNSFEEPMKPSRATRSRAAATGAGRRDRARSWLGWT